MTEAFPQAVPVSILDRRDPGFDADAVRDLEQLAGREKFDASRFLRRNNSETVTLYTERCARAFNVPRLGHLVETLAAGVFHREPRVKLEGVDEGGQTWRTLLGTADGGSADLNVVLRSSLERALLHEESWVWVDFPRRPDGAGDTMSVAEAEAIGLHRPTLTVLEPGALRAHAVDEKGRLLWAIIGQEETHRPSPLSAAVEIVRRWCVLRATTWAIYEHRRRSDVTASDAGEARLTASGTYRFGRVPLTRLVLPPRLVLGCQLLSLSKAILSLDNAVFWQQHTSLYAMPVVKSKKDFKQTVGAAYFVHLEPGDEFTYAEPAGSAMAASMTHRAELREEFYRVGHGTALGFGSSAVVAGRSGESKRQDWRSTDHALSHLGALVRDLALDIIQLVAAGRGQKVGATVTGLDSFDLDATAQRIEEHASADSMIRSRRWRTERGRSLVRRLMPELGEKVLAEIDKELEADVDDFEPPKFGGSE